MKFEIFKFKNVTSTNDVAIDLIKKEKEEMKKLEQAVIRVQSRWRMKQGRFAYHLKMRARKADIAQAKALEDAALRVQSAWRKKKGEWAKHMKMRAREADRLQKE